MSALRAVFLTFVAAIATLLVSAPLGAAETSVRAVVLTIAGNDADAKAMGAVAQELLDRLGVELSVRRVDRVALWEIAEPPDAAHPESARAWIDLTQASRAVLFVKDAVHDRVLLRELARSPDGDELMREELGHILQASIEGLLAGSEIGAPRSELLDSLGGAPAPSAPPAPAPVPVRPTPPSPPKRRAPAAHAPLAVAPPAREHTWDVTVLFELGRASSDHTTGAAGALLEARPFVRSSLGASLGGAVRLPMTIHGDPISARLSGGLVRAALTWDAPLGGQLSLRFAAGGGVDAVRIAPQTSADPSVVRLAAPRTIWSAVARAGAGLQDWVGGFGLWFGLALDFDPNGTTYVYARHVGTDVVFRPWAVRPALQIGVVL